MLAACVAHASVGGGSTSPINWTVSTFYGYGGFAAYLTGAGTYQFSAVPTSSITLVRWSLNTAIGGDLVSSNTPIMGVKIFDAALTSLTTQLTEYAGFVIDEGSTPSGGMQLTVVGAMLVDDAAPPGAGFPYEWEADVHNFSSGTNTIQVTLMSWAK